MSESLFYLFIYLFIYLFMYLSTYLSIFIHLFIYSLFKVGQTSKIVYVPALETAHILNVHKMFLRQFGRLLKVLLHAQFTSCVQTHKSVHAYTNIEV